jgi:hypothetical protein
MSAEATPPNQSTAAPEPLQFERAEFGHGAALSCSFCKTPVPPAGEYFQINGQTACPNCRQQLDSAVTGGSKFARTLRAIAAGVAAAVAGFLIYWSVRVFTGYEFGLIAILIGFMVGAAVRWGAQARGGLFYQLMAVVLTYLSIASNYTPDVLKGMRDPAPEEPVTAAANSPSTTREIDVAKNPPTTTANAAPSDQDEQRPIPLWFALPVAFVISLAVPFMDGLNIIGWVIIGFGLFQAWKINKRIPIEVSGPFNTGGASPQTAPLLQT